MLTDLPTAKLTLGVSSTDTSKDQWISTLIPQATSIIQHYCKSLLETRVITEYPSGADIQAMWVRERPVRRTKLTGTLTANSATVTGLSSTSTLLVGMPAIAFIATPGMGYSPAIPVGATILSVDSTTQVTLSAPATLGGSFTLMFGLAVYLDAAGFYGDGPGGFSALTQLVIGLDYAVKWDRADGSSKSGLFQRLGAGVTGGALTGGWPNELRRGSLTAKLAPVWSLGLGNVQVIYTAGWGIGPISAVNSGTGNVGNLPQDLVAACGQLVGWMMRSYPKGGAIDSETIGRYSYHIRFPQPNEPPEVGSLRQILSTYRETIG